MLILQLAERGKGRKRHYLFPIRERHENYTHHFYLPFVGQTFSHVGNLAAHGDLETQSLLCVAFYLAKIYFSGRGKIKCDGKWEIYTTLSKKKIFIILITKIYQL